MADVAPVFAEALKLHQAGQLAEAELAYQRILASEPAHFDSLHLLGVIFMQRGDPVAAIAQIGAALKVAPHHILALNNRGNAFQQLQRFGDALESYDRALSVRPDYVEALINRGVTLNALKRYDEALTSYDRAITLRPDFVEAHSNRGNVLAALGRRAGALASFDRAIALRPDYAEAHYNRGNLLYTLKRYEEALKSHDRAVAIRPDYVDALTNRGATLHMLDRDDEGLASIDRALALDPDNAEALTNRGVALNALKRYAEALIGYERALALCPDHAEALTNRGVALHELGRLDEALKSYDHALELRPDDAEALSNRGHTLHELERYEDSLASCDRALLLQPDLADAHCNRGNALNALQRFDEALVSYDQALALRPDNAKALTNRGIALHALKRFDDELASYARALAVEPDYADAHFNSGWCRMLHGDFRAFKDYEWRWKIDRLKSSKRNFAQPHWTAADDGANKTVLLHAEQGFGDTIQFCRYAPLVAQRVGRLILEVQEPLRDLVGVLPGVTQVVSRGEALPDFDVHCPLLSLPLLMETELATIPSQVPYLGASPQGVAEWGARLGSRSRPRIGLAWSGNPTHKNDRNRSAALAALLPLLGLDATYVSLQPSVRAADAELLRNRDIVHFGEQLRDFSDTAALIANLDLVISVDTAVAHLAGALAKPVWVLLPFVPDWRWLLDRDDSPWYPTMRLFRQDQSRTWDNVIARVSARLRDQFVG